MGKREAGCTGLLGRPTVFDVGIGVLYFFTSHMVIRALYYVGIDRTPWELAVFFLTVIGHHPRPRLRRPLVARAPDCGDERLSSRSSMI